MSEALQAETVIDNVSLPQGKRKAEDDEAEGSESAPKAAKTTMAPKARETRLEQNRKAARESRRRKRIMLEELQRSVIFFSRANGALKQQNDELTRLLMQANLQVAQLGNQKEGGAAATSTDAAATEEPTAAAKKAASDEQKKADTVATQAMFESQGFPAAAARAAAQAMNGNLDEKAATAAADATGAAGGALPTMQPGSTMQAMSNFQAAASAAMQQAMGQMKGVPGLNQMAAAPVGSNPQHAFTDAMTAIAMQQHAAAAAAAAGQQMVLPSVVATAASKGEEATGGTQV